MMAKAKERVFADLVELAESGLDQGRVEDGWFTSKLWYKMEFAPTGDGEPVKAFASTSTVWTYLVERLLHDEKLRKSIRMTAAMGRLPKVSGRVSVSFKSEDEQHGQVVGPVVVYDHEVYDKDPEAAKGGLGVPFGYTPQGMHQLGWQKLSVARRVAKHYGVELEEW
jgi:hypothetical protein